MIRKKVTTGFVYSKVLRYNWKMEDFKKYLGCDESQFTLLFNSLFKYQGRDVKELWKQITAEPMPKNKAKNKVKNKAKKALPSEVSSEKNSEEKSESVATQHEEVSENGASDIAEPASIQYEEVSEDGASDIAEPASMRIEKMRQKVLALEIRQGNLSKHERIYQSELYELKTKIKKSEFDLKEILSTIDTLTAETVKIKNGMEQVAQKKKKIKEEIAEINKKIAKDSAIEIFMFKQSDDTTDILRIESALPINCPDSWKRISKKIRDCEEADALTGHEIKALAKVIAIYQSLIDTNIPFITVFETDIVEKLYDSLKDSEF